MVSGKMKALVAEGWGRFVLKEVDIPKIGPREVLVRVRACGVDRTDVIGWLRTEYVAAGYRTRQAFKFPVIPGAENSGEIVEIGSEVTRFKVGDKVTVEYYTDFCGECSYCRTGQYNLCPYSKGKGELGRSIDGCFAVYMKAPESALIKVPDTVPHEDACLTEMAAVAMHGIRRSGFGIPGGIAAIIGVGVIGLAALQILKTLGHEVIVAGVQRDEEFGRLKIAERFGADRVVNLDKEDFSRVTMEMRSKGFYKDKEGFDVVVVASPSPQAADLALRAIRPGGKIIQIGHPHSREPISITYYNVLDDVTIYGTSVSTREDWERSLALMASGKLRFAPEAITKYSLDEWEKGFRDFWEGKVIRSVIIP